MMLCFYSARLPLLLPILWFLLCVSLWHSVCYLPFSFISSIAFLIPFFLLMFRSCANFLSFSFLRKSCFCIRVLLSLVLVCLILSCAVILIVPLLLLVCNWLSSFSILLSSSNVPFVSLPSFPYTEFCLFVLFSIDYHLIVFCRLPFGPSVIFILSWNLPECRVLFLMLSLSLLTYPIVLLLDGWLACCF